MSVTSVPMTVAIAPTAVPPMPETLIDAETTRLAIEAQRGSADAFCALMDLHQRAAQRVAAAALPNGADVEEVVQDACVTAWQQIGHLHDPGAFRAWLLRITWRKALDRRRSVTSWLRRLHTTLTGRQGESPADPLATVADGSPSAHDQLVSRERDRIVAQVIRSLPSRLRDPFLLAASGEHRYDDIAEMLGIPSGTVKWRVAEARRLLRAKLARVGFR